MPTGGVTTRKSFGSKFAIRTGCGRLLSASCGNSNPKSSRLENPEQIPRVARRGALARDADARRIVGSRLEMCFRERLMCVLVPVRNFSVVCFERVRSISVCWSVPVRSGLDHLCRRVVGYDAKVCTEAVGSILGINARNFVWLAPAGAAKAAARWTSSGVGLFLCSGPQLRPARGLVGGALFVVEDVGEAGSLGVFGAWAGFSGWRGTGGLLRSFWKLGFRGVF